MRHFSIDEAWLLIFATRWTVLLTLTAFVGGGIGGAIVAVARVSPLRFVRWIAATYIRVLQGIPLLILLFLVFFGHFSLALRATSRPQGEVRALVRSIRT